MKNLNKLARQINDANRHWWTDLGTGEPIQRNKGELLMLTVSELAECMEGERKDLMDDHLPHRKMAEVELADAKIRLLDYAGGFGFWIDESFDHVEIVVDCLPCNKGDALLAITAEVASVLKSPIGGYYLASALLHIEAYALKFGYDLEGAMLEKLEYNKHRADHKIENRKAEGGKKW